MARRTTAPAAALPGLNAPTSAAQTVAAAHLPKIQNALPLFRWFCRWFGANDFAELQAALRDARQETHTDGQTQFYHVLQARNGMKATPADLLAYDANIQADLARLNRNRKDTVRLTYFQYLALLFAEAFLHRRNRDADGLRHDLNQFVTRENALLNAQGKRWRYAEYAPDDLNKIAFWSATGSGKTLLMHLNLYQWRRYATSADRACNVLLITPNEDLSRQHLREMGLSGIRAVRLGDSDSGLYTDDTPTVEIVEITKIAEKRRGQGQSVTVDELDGYKLVLVDEGHRGASGDTWRGYRQRIAERSLTLEYSATFGQIVNGASAAKKPILWTEYSKAILFDYSYPRFYGDGYGKDYRIVNVDDDTGHASYWAMLGSLLGFYEQARLFNEAPDTFKPYNLDRPLWVFVGNSVTGGKKESSADLTDIEEICAFFRDFLNAPPLWTTRLEALLTGQTGLRRGDGLDLFAEGFPYVKGLHLSAADLYADIARVVFRARPGDQLKAALLKNAPGEIALRTGSDNPPFAVISVGDVAGLRKLMEDPGQIPTDDDPLTPSLFAALHRPESPVSVLIGSRKFMEGWDSFRVSSMGLMNIGTGEGSQIIQLFGRGVRLRGRNWCLKRTRATRDGDAPPNIGLLETLNVYGVRANYMAKFRENLRNEGIETDFDEIAVPIERNAGFLQKQLPVLRLDAEYDESAILDVHHSIKIRLDLRPKTEIAVSQDGLDAGDKAGEYDGTQAFKERLPLLDWPALMCAVQEFRRVKMLSPIAVTEASLRGVLAKGDYTVLCLPDYMAQARFTDLRRVQQIAESLCKQYLSKYYDRRKAAWETAHLTLQTLTESDANLEMKEYRLKIACEQQALITQIKALATTGSELYRKDVADFPNVHFDRHLYQPLLKKDERIATCAPPGLEPSEEKFLRDLRNHIRLNPAWFADKELFLLRNQSRGTGIGFFDGAEGEGFYPDFLMWLYAPNAHYLAFIDPHGIRNDQNLNNHKYTLWRRLRDEFEPRLQPAPPALPLHLTSFVLAPDTFAYAHDKLWVSSYLQQEIDEQHIVFQGDHDHLHKLFALLTDNSPSGAGVSAV